MNIKISVIIPIYNTGELLYRSLDSVKNQTYRNLEVIMVDDGSTDNSAAICKEYVTKDPRFFYYYEMNSGPSAARNLGLEKCTGDYIAFLDPDDYLHVDMYSKLLGAIRESNAGMAICDFRVVYGDEPYNSEPPYKTQILNRHQAQEIYFADSHSATIATVVWNKLIPASVMKKFRFPVDRMVGEDESVTYQLLYSFSKIVFVKAPYYNYYVCDGSIMNRPFHVKRFDLFKAYDERINFYAKHKEYDLCKKMFFLYIHMFCQYRELGKESGEDFSNVYKKCFYRERNKYHKFKSDLHLSVSEKVELDLFNNAPSVYHRLWKVLKHSK